MFLTNPQETPIFVEESPPEVEIVSSRRTHRGRNFSTEEDELLVSSWLNTSMDVVQGTELKQPAFWNRVHSYFHEYKDFSSERTSSSLMNRWSMIQSVTNKFCGYLAQVELLNQSGMTEQDKISKAKRMYQSFHKASFPFDHCWTLLREQPKWLLKEKLKKKRSMSTSSPHTLESPIHDGGEDVSCDSNVELEPPTRRNAEKENGERKASTSKDIVICMKKKTEILEEACGQEKDIIRIKGEKLRLEQSREEHRICIEEKMNMERERFRLKQLKEEERMNIEGEKLRLELLKEEERIMMLDTSGLSLMQQEYYRQRQMEILESRKIQKASTLFSPKSVEWDVSARDVRHSKLLGNYKKVERERKDTIGELTTENEELRAANDRLEAKVEALKKRIAELDEKAFELEQVNEAFINRRKRRTVNISSTESPVANDAPVMAPTTNAVLSPVPLLNPKFSPSRDPEPTQVDSVDARDSHMDNVIGNLKTESWANEVDMLIAFSRDARLCMYAVCALYRHHVSAMRSGEGSSSSKDSRFNHFDALSVLKITTLTQFLTDWNLEGQLKKSISEFHQYQNSGIEECRTLATRYSTLLFEIYKKNGDPLFRHC